MHILLIHFPELHVPAHVHLERWGIFHNINLVVKTCATCCCAFGIFNLEYSQLYENAELFCQFDFIINEISEIEVAEADIKLVPASISSSSSGLVM